MDQEWQVIYLFTIKKFRFSQNNLLKYGSCLLVFEITSLNKNKYEEKFINEIKVNNLLGPHTFSINKKMRFILIFIMKNLICSRD